MKIIKKSGKRIVRHTFSSKDKKSAIINISGMSITESEEPYAFSGFIRKNYNNIWINFEDSYDIYSYQFFATSVFNKKLSNLKVEEYAKEIKIMINDLEKKYENIIIYSTSFSSLCILLTLYKYKFKSQLKIIMGGPAFFNSSAHLKWRIKQKNSKVTKLIDAAKWNKAFLKKQLIKNYDYWSEKLINKKFSFPFIIIYGDEENFKVIEHIKLFNSINNSLLFQLKNRKHLINKKNDEEEYEEIIALLKSVI